MGTPAAARARRGGRGGPEEGEEPDRWAPPVGERERGGRRRGGLSGPKADWAAAGRLDW
jgi:hypothetical protein